MALELDFIKIGNRVEIIPLDSENQNLKYASLVEENYGNGRLLLYIPMMYGRLVKLPIGKVYNFVFTTEEGIVGFNAEVAEYVYHDDFNFLLIKLTKEVSKVQRREFFRFECVLPLKFDKISGYISGKQFDEKEAKYEGIIKDLGEGGIKFLSNDSAVVGESYKFFITLNYDSAFVTGTILQRQEYPKSNYKFQYRVKFEDLKSEEREKIVKYIFFEQRFKAREDRRELQSDNR